MLLDPVTGKIIQSDQVSADSKNVQCIDWQVEKGERQPQSDLIVAITDQDAVMYEFNHQKQTMARIVGVLPGEKLNCCIFTNCGSIIFGGYQRMHVWKLSSSKSQTTLLESISAHDNIISDLCVHGDLVASCGHDSLVNVWTCMLKK
jgi:WD40 repeat protein